MRAPSNELLRALRSATTAELSTTTARTTTTFRCSALPRRPVHSQFSHHGHDHSVTTTRTSRAFSTTTRLQQPPRSAFSYSLNRNPNAPKNTDRGPVSKEDTQTDFGKMDVLGHIPVPATSVDACTTDGFHLDNGVKTTGGDGILLVGGEAFRWAPWVGLKPPSTGSTATISTLLDPRKGILHIPPQSLGLLALLHPKPDLLIFGTGARLWMLAPDVRKYLSEELGCRVDVMDTANAAAAYNLLAKERGIDGGAGVGAAFLPVGWRGPKTVK